MTPSTEHLPCPECGYDLYGMAEGRCPECGFGFDREAVQRIHEHRAERRIIAGAGIIRSAAVALALNVSMLSWLVGVGPFGRLILVPIALGMGICVWARFADMRLGERWV